MPMKNFWEQWNRKNIKFLKTLQQPDGSINGNKGKAFSTSASLLSLALKLPIFTHIREITMKLPILTNHSSVFYGSRGRENQSRRSDVQGRRQFV